MNSQTAQTITPTDESAIRAFHRQMIDAWNRGSGEGFAAPFSETADFLTFEGTHLKGRKEIAAFHQQAFDTVVKGTHLEGEVNFVRFVNSQLALMHVVIRVILAGRTETSPSRDSLPLYVVTKGDEGWQIEGLLNTRKLTLERQFFLDDFDSLSAEAQRQVTDFVAGLKQQQQADLAQI
ncbi:MAG: SgcJ/EcaC family oxidoreductase [Cyanobacteria bacterium RU_5_0]|nr:SgcJ/EcaC family oxidoreductase [Cyanobacteria bacterium RU_5_0]